MNEETKKFILEHLDKDVYKLGLKAVHDPEIDVKFALQQISGRQQIRYKVPTFYENNEIIYPKRLSLEQSSSELSAGYKADIIKGKSLIDLTGGLGIDCFFLSKNFEKTTYIEQQKELCEIAVKNFNALNSNIEVVNCNSEDYIHKISTTDTIYVDPARRDYNGKKMVLLQDCSPDIERLVPRLLEKVNTILIKLSPMLDISTVLSNIPDVKEIHVLAIENECKEIIVLIEKNNNAAAPIIKAVNLSKKGNQSFEYYIENEQKNNISYTSILKDYLYEPNAAIMKSGGFKTLSINYNIQKLHPNTHLYTSDKRISDFPGRIFRIVRIWSETQKELKKHAKSLGKANLTTRNYPVKAEELKKKLKLSDGGNCYLFACTPADNKKIILECEKI